MACAALPPFRWRRRLSARSSVPMRTPASSVPRMRWVPALQGARGGVGAVDWAPNLAADEAARAAAVVLRFPAPARAQPAVELRAPGCVPSVLAAVGSPRWRPVAVRRRRYPRTGQLVRLLGDGTVTAGRGMRHMTVHSSSPCRGRDGMGASPPGGTPAVARRPPGVRRWSPAGHAMRSPRTLRLAGTRLRACLAGGSDVPVRTTLWQRAPMQAA